MFSGPTHDGTHLNTVRYVEREMKDGGNKPDVAERYITGRRTVVFLLSCI